jgi:hypothetical protein
MKVQKERSSSTVSINQEIYVNEYWAGLGTELFARFQIGPKKNTKKKAIRRWPDFLKWCL